ncbi:hypothetical protein TVAG_357450 [Trichomonas vaginalis G3]|uniref:Uncharacterized protein n=1 Tax=Trichomonas vaginalis (strain ATCC PRA-98 / G3) TaxID=412133 RepID=A2F9P6_TRIV3|nr:hypothetical protein TVAGG3_0429440 [Trichomonas vaginalis G3]EAX98376.1 hypothetical protein TVAG_357450 [Trichomonas vaginalis G3]KAI5536648.1 hypothetical protein TVAGG3_0429440 [Trichomonas vaginalis G3]|eukprot:XP_001311306.1 hypothetical protein [Trichomonas vaginalis G3]
MGCAASNGTNFNEEEFFQSLPSESSLEVLETTRNSGVFKQRLELLKSITTDISNKTARDLTNIPKKSILIICETLNPKTQTDAVCSVNDSILTAKCAEAFGFSTFTLINPQITTMLTAIRIFLSKVTDNLMIFYNGFHKASSENPNKSFLTSADQLIQMKIFIESFHAYKLPSSNVSFFVDVDHTDIGQITVPNNLPPKCAIFTPTSKAFLSYFIWKALKVNKSISIKDLIDTINQQLEPLGGKIQDLCGSDINRESPFINS